VTQRELENQLFGKSISSQHWYLAGAIVLQKLFHLQQLTVRKVQQSYDARLQSGLCRVQQVAGSLRRKEVMDRSERQSSFVPVAQLAAHCHPNPLDRRLTCHSFFDSAQRSQCACKKIRDLRAVSR